MSTLIAVRACATCIQPTTEARGSNTSPQLRLQRRRPQRAIIPILERHGHDLGRAIDRDMAEKLQAVAGRMDGRTRRLHVHELRPEGVVERTLRAASSVDRP